MKNSNDLLLIIISIIALSLIYKKISIHTIITIIIISIIGYSIIKKRIGLSICIAVIVTYFLTMLQPFRRKTIKSD